VEQIKYGEQIVENAQKKLEEEKRKEEEKAKTKKLH
jgi:hypothetical protein